MYVELKIHHKCLQHTSHAHCDTGVAFTKTTQPQFSVQLKQQIDGYLSRHEGVRSGLGQTLGSAREIASHLSAEDGRGWLMVGLASGHEELSSVNVV